jgi:uncharacterized membrane protein YfcA
VASEQSSEREPSAVAVERPRTVRVETEPAADRRQGRRYGRLGVIGLAGGLFSGLLGVGGGVVMVPLLVFWGGFRQRDAHAVSLGAIIPISAAGVLTFGAAGEIHLWEAAALAVGAIAGAQVGARLLARADERRLKLAFGVFLLIVAALMAVGR